MTITAANRSLSKAPDSRHSKAAVVLAGGLGLLLLVSGAVRLVAGIVTLDPRAVLSELVSGKRVPEAEMLKAADSIATAEILVADAELEADRAFLLLRAAEKADPADQMALREAAENSGKRSLAQAPVQPNTWMYLALLRERQNDVAGAVAALRLSMLSGSFVPSLMVTRTTMGIRLLAAMDDETKLLLKRQVRLTWVVAPSLVMALQYQPGAQVLIAEALKELSDSELARAKRIHGKAPPP